MLSKGGEKRAAWVADEFPAPDSHPPPEAWVYFCL